MTNADVAAKWMDKARNDLLAAQRLFEFFNPKQLDISCYHCQQAGEKALKAVLIFREAVDEVPRAHDLEILLNACAPIDKNFEEFRSDCNVLTPYATQTRYPGNREFTEEETAAALRKAERIVSFCASLINPDPKTE
jgi:HEPN domain-containing protein